MCNSVKREVKLLPFRIKESKVNGFENAANYLTNLPQNGLTDTEKKEARAYLMNLVRWIGPVVGSYPVWHPLVSSMRTKSCDATYPSQDCGYFGLDHVVFICSWLYYLSLHGRS